MLKSTETWFSPSKKFQLLWKPFTLIYWMDSKKKLQVASIWVERTFHKCQVNCFMELENKSKLTHVLFIVDWIPIANSLIVLFIIEISIRSKSKRDLLAIIQLCKPKPAYWKSFCQLAYQIDKSCLLTLKSTYSHLNSISDQFLRF